MMHTIVLRRDIYRAHPWAAQSLYKAFVESQRLVYEDFRETAALKTMLPWLTAQVEEVQKEMGADWWPYGFESNRHVIGDISTLPPRTGALQAQAPPRGAVRARNALGLQDLTSGLLEMSGRRKKFECGISVKEIRSAIVFVR